MTLGGVTENYNQNGIGTTQVPNSLVNGAPGVFWAIEPLLYSATTNFYVYKGVWNSSTSDIVWNINYTVTPPYNTSFYYYPFPDYNIAFDPTGQIGYVSIGAQLNTGSTNAAINPVLYKTTNGGTSWTGPILVDMSKFSCISTNTTSGNVPSTNQEHDLVVDMYGNPHIVTTVGGASSYAMNYNGWHHMYDITLKNCVWAAYDLGNVKGAPYSFGTSPDIVAQYQAPQAGRTADGSKVFFTWTDNTSYTLGQGNSLPNLFTKAFDVVQDKWTSTKEVSSCNTSANGKILYPHISPEVLEPSSGTYEVPVVYGEMTVANNLLAIANFIYLDNVTFSSTEFTISTPAATVTIPQGPNLLVCPTGTSVINIAGAVGEALWSNGANTTTLGITSSTVTTYSVVAQVGCNVGTASISVTTMTLNADATSTGVCPGQPATFTVGGNALGYTWTPGSVTGTNVTLNPTGSQVTLTALGGGSCTSVQTVSVNILPPPTIVITGNDTICDGYTEIYTASGAASYQWNTGASTSTMAVTPTQNTVYTVIGTAANTCTNMQTFSVAIIPSPTINVSGTHSAVCVGSSATLAALGAGSFSWAPGSQLTSTIAASPAVTTVYTVTGIGANLCTRSKTIELVVNPQPTLNVTLSRAMICAGEKGTLTASGATSYTWVSPGSTNATVMINPVATTNYTVIGKNSFGCSDTLVYNQVVSQCVGVDNQFMPASFRVYPNPNNGSFTIQCDSESLLSIVNSLGQTVVQIDGREGETLCIKDLARGLYFIYGRSGNRTAITKIVVQ
jgi:hypothetical protein